jgi:O-antigen/teichoic acid export membrane protein
MADAFRALPATMLPAPATERPEETLTRRASLNAGAALLAYAVKTAVGLVVVPILVLGLGRTVFGVWEMLQRLVGYISAADGRPTMALRLVVAHGQADENVALKRRYVGSALLVWVLFLPVLLAAGAVLTWLAPGITGSAPALGPMVRLVCAILVIAFLLENLASLPESVLRGMNLGYKRLGMQAGLNVVGGLLTVGAVLAGLGLVGVAAAQAVLAGLAGICFWFIVRRVVPWFGLARPTRADVRALFGVSAWYSAGELLAVLLVASDALILGMVISASAVTTYVLTGYAARLALSLHTLAAGALMPGLGGVIGARDHARALRLRGELMALTWVLVTTVGAVVLLGNRSFLHLWVGDGFHAGRWSDVLIVVAFVQTAFIRNDAYIIDATLRLRGRVMGALAAVAAVFLLAPPLTARYGIVGLCAGMIAGRMIQTAAYPWLVQAALAGRRPGARSLIGGAIRAVRPVLVTLLLFAAGTALGDRWLAEGWAEWLAVVGLGFVLTGLVALGAGVPAEQRRAVVSRLGAASLVLRRGPGARP